MKNIMKQILNGIGTGIIGLGLVILTRPRSGVGGLDVRKSIMKSFISINGKTIENPIVKYSILGFAILIFIPALTLLIIPLIGVALAFIAAAIILVAVVAPIVLIFGMSKPMYYFGSTDPRLMPKHLFWGAVHIDYPSAVRGNPEKQNYSVCPRYWYIDADFVCKGCRKNFTWTAAEQKAWFEDYFFWIDSSPRHCKTCSSDRRHLTALRAEYDSIVAEACLKDATDKKIRVIEIVRELEAAFGRLPEKMIETKELFDRQIKKAQQDAPSNGG